MKKENISNIIRSCPVFCLSSEETMQTLLSCPVLKYKAGENIRPDNAGLCIVLSGKITADDTACENKVRLNIFSSGGAIGICSMFGGDYSSSLLSAKNDASLLFIRESIFSNILVSDKNVMLSYVKFLSGKIRFLNSKITSFTSVNADAAVAGYLVSLESNCLSNMSETARRLDIGRTSLYRSLSRLEEAGALSRENGKYIITNRTSLIAFAASTEKEKK